MKIDQFKYPKNFNLYIFVISQKYKLKSNMLKKTIHLATKNITSSVKIQPYSFDYLTANLNKKKFFSKKQTK